MATTSPGSENPNTSGTETGRRETCAPMMFCCPFVTMLSCMARMFQDCADAMTRDAPKAG